MRINVEENGIKFNENDLVLDTGIVAKISVSNVGIDDCVEDKYFNDNHTEEEFTIYLDYPLSVTVSVIVPADSYKDLGKKICDIYKEIYREEVSSSKMTESLMDGTYNRNRTNGIYGIWGHCIDDLIIENVLVYKGNKVRVYVGS